MAGSIDGGCGLATAALSEQWSLRERLSGRGAGASGTGVISSGDTAITPGMNGIWEWFAWDASSRGGGWVV